MGRKGIETYSCLLLGSPLIQSVGIIASNCFWGLPSRRSVGIKYLIVLIETDGTCILDLCFLIPLLSKQLIGGKFDGLGPSYIIAEVAIVGFGTSDIARKHDGEAARVRLWRTILE